VRANTDGNMPREITLPNTLPCLRWRLKETQQGQALLGLLTKEAIEEEQEEKCRACQAIRPFPKVLVVLRRLGNYPGAEVYAEEGVSVRFLELPEMSAEGEIGKLAEEFIEVSVPRSWRHLVGLPAKRIRRDVFRGVSLSETVRYQEDAEAIREIRETLVEVTR